MFNHLSKRQYLSCRTVLTFAILAFLSSLLRLRSSLLSPSLSLSLLCLDDLCLLLSLESLLSSVLTLLLLDLRLLDLW